MFQAHIEPQAKAVIQINSFQFFIIYVPSQQPQGQLQTQHSNNNNNTNTNNNNNKLLAQFSP
jgi:hypothetical protein